MEKYRIKPFEWHKVKAIAGCSSDNVKGVAGVGEITAIKYLKGELKKESKAHQNIINKLEIGNEVITNGGLLGKITHIENSILSLSISENT